MIIASLIAACASVMVAVIQIRMGKKVNETHKQVSVNSHSSEKPTVLDLISELRDEQRETNRRLTDHFEWHLENR